MNPRIVNGWLVVPYAGSDRVAVHISIEPYVWLPAFLDYIDGERVAKVRVAAPAGTILKMRLRAGSAETAFPTIRV